MKSTNILTKKLENPSNVLYWIHLVFKMCTNYYAEIHPMLTIDNCNEPVLLYVLIFMKRSLVPDSKQEVLVLAQVVMSKYIVGLISKISVYNWCYSRSLHLH